MVNRRRRSQQVQDRAAKLLAELEQDKGFQQMRHRTEAFLTGVWRRGVRYADDARAANAREGKKKKRDAAPPRHIDVVLAAVMDKLPAIAKITDKELTRCIHKEWGADCGKTKPTKQGKKPSIDQVRRARERYEKIRQLL